MGLIAHANIMPWSVDPGFFVSLFAYLLDAVALSIAAGVIYALTRGLLRLGDDRGQPLGPFTRSRKIPKSINYREGSQHEA